MLARPKSQLRVAVSFLFLNSNGSVESSQDFVCSRLRTAAEFGVWRHSVAGVVATELGVPSLFDCLGVLQSSCETFPDLLFRDTKRNMSNTVTTFLSV